MKDSFNWWNRGFKSIAKMPKMKVWTSQVDVIEWYFIGPLKEEQVLNQLAAETSF